MNKTFCLFEPQSRNSGILPYAVLKIDLFSDTPQTRGSQFVTDVLETTHAPHPVPSHCLCLRDRAIG